MLKYKNKDYTRLEKKVLRVRKLERSESAVNLKFEFENFPLIIQLSQKMSPDFAPESPLSREKILFAIFNLLLEIPPSDLFKRFKGEAIATVQPLSISHYFL